MTHRTRNIWGWTLTARANTHMLWFVAGLCGVLLLAGLLVPAPDMPFISDLPFGAAVSAFSAALVAVVLAWPLRFLLRRRAGYYTSSTTPEDEPGDAS